MSYDTGLGIAAVVVLPLLIAIAVVSSRFAALRHDKGIVTAALRAVVQLAVVGLVVGFALQSTPGALAFIAVMLSVATITSARRVRSTAVVPGQYAFSAVSIGGAATVVLLLLVLPGVVPRNPETLLPMGGIIIGGAMNATTLAGRRLLSEYGGRFGEYEAGLSIGLMPPDAFKLVAGPTAGDALLPALDQTRTVGLVTLPGAFVGMVLGGASPTAAAALQLVVLIGLIAAESMAILMMTELLARASLPDGRTVSP
ncbi:putative ABC transport system permease protein [Kribbella orskensis]|uniref:ABC transport system permease protein n=1 Tax=Kribbella orskensis TaxID=2512216 RepID=A0ABY2BDV5_9ACTN|nr:MULTISPECIES: ABC transporter permease [Kribbella]TCN35751.1 putative ABC transport system permease protein [Kribbella sp. VKM Ac-2500]TCO17358.1 putative ABC transport system permease protein [Kribbella orskensis]